MSKAVGTAARVRAHLSKRPVRVAARPATTAATQRPIAADVEARPTSSLERRIFDAEQLVSSSIGDTVWADRLQSAAVDLQPRRKRIACISQLMDYPEFSHMS